MEIIKHDIVVCGAGATGLRAAVEAQKFNKNVAVVSKVHPMRVQSTMATSLNAAFREGDKWENHVFDTVKGSDYLGDEDAITYLCEHGKEDTLELERFGLIYSRDPDGGYTKKSSGSGGQGFARSIFTADRTGHTIVRTLYGYLQKTNVRIYDEWIVTKIIIENAQVRGLTCINLKTGELFFIETAVVVVCTGGYGQVFYPRSTNALNTTGDGMALAFEAGARLLDMEFVQFHPTSLLGTNILMSEACRSSGAYLLNNDGRRFMEKYAPEKIELATRDVVSRGIQSEIELGNGINGEECVYLDLRHLGAKKIMHYLPKNRELAIQFSGRDMIDSPIPIQPAQHYSMGGIEVNINGETSVKGLLAAGETACVSVQGANRLGGNSVLETIVFGKHSGAKAAELVRNFTTDGVCPREMVRDEESRLKGMLANNGKEKGAALKRELGRVMNDNVGIFRTAESLSTAIEQVRELRQRVKDIGIAQKNSCLFNNELVDRLEVDNMTLLAEAIATCALAREESRGSHFRRDFPKRDDEKWGCHSAVTLNDDGGFSMTTKPVTRIKHMPAVRTY
jgi:succinate dehydrogenase / fumarate reductase flavoprotein subunit